MWQITEKIIVRKFDESDAQNILQSVNNNREYLRQWLPWLDNNICESDFIKFITDCIIGYQTGKSFVLGLWDQATSLHVGNIGFNSIHDGVGEIGYWLANDYQHQGIIHQTCNWLIEYGFYELSLYKIIIHIATKNIKSRRVAEQLGFSCGELQPQAEWLYDHFVDHFEYRLTADDFSPHQINTTLSLIEQDEYLKHCVMPAYQPALQAEIYQTIYNSRFEIIMCTDKSSQSVGLEESNKSRGGSYRYYADLAYISACFGDEFYNGNEWKISNYIHKIFNIQKFVFEQQRAINYIDILPYNNTFISYLITLVPIFHPCGKVIAIQSIATKYRFINFNEHLVECIGEIEPPPSELNLSSREHEIMFLLANGITQEHIAQILHISRSTVAAIIRNQLCLKFNIAGSNTKRLADLSVHYGYYKNIPRSLFHSAVILLDEYLTQWLERKKPKHSCQPCL